MAQREPGDSRCKDCANPHEPDHVRCADCLARRRIEASELAATRRKRRLCVTCGGKPANGRRYCPTHLAYYLERGTRISS